MKGIIMNNEFDLILKHHAEQCETDCVQWLNNFGETGREQIMQIVAETAATLSKKQKKEFLDEEEKINLLLSFFAMNGINKAWESLQERQTNEIG